MGVHFPGAQVAMTLRKSEGRGVASRPLLYLCLSTRPGDQTIPQISSNYFKIDYTMVSSAIAGVEIFLRCIDTTFPSKQSYLVQRMDPPHC